MLRFRTLTDALKNFDVKLNLPEETDKQVFAEDLRIVKECPDKPHRFYLVGPVPTMVDHVAAVQDPERRDFYEVVRGRCHFYTVFNAPVSSDKLEHADVVFHMALRNLIPHQMVSSISHSMLLLHEDGKKKTVRIRWQFRSPSGAVVMLASPKDAETLFWRVCLDIRKEHNPYDLSKNSFFYSDEKGDFIPIADPTVYKENTLLPTAGSVKTNADGKCTGWLVDPLHCSEGREETMVSRYVFVNNLVCHANPFETLPVEILDVSKL